MCSPNCRLLPIRYAGLKRAGSILCDGCALNALSEKGGSILCDGCALNALGVFYIRFFSGDRKIAISQKRRGNCGKRFLPPLGEYFDCCEDPPSGCAKTCRRRKE